jgi:hypothetical protein
MIASRDPTPPIGCLQKVRLVESMRAFKGVFVHLLRTAMAQYMDG